MREILSTKAIARSGASARRAGPPDISGLLTSLINVRHARVLVIIAMYLCNRFDRKRRESSGGTIVSSCDSTCSESSSDRLSVIRSHERDTVTT